MTITYALMEKYEDICKNSPEKARLISKAKVSELLSDANGNVTGVKYHDREGKYFEEHGQVFLH